MFRFPFPLKTSALCLVFAFQDPRMFGSRKSSQTPSSGASSFGDMQRRLKFLGLQKLGVAEVLSDENTEDFRVVKKLEKIALSTETLMTSKHQLVDHMNALTAFQASAEALSSSVSLFGSDESPISPELGPFAISPGGPGLTLKTTLHCIQEHCITLINQSLEVSNIISMKAKVRHDMVLDYSNYKRAYDAAEGNAKTPPDDLARKRLKLDCSVAAVKTATSALEKLLNRFLQDLVPALTEHVRAGLIASHRFISRQLLSSVEGGRVRDRNILATTLEKEMIEMHDGLGLKGKVLTKFKTQYTNLKDLILDLADESQGEFTALPFAKDLMTSPPSELSLGSKPPSTEDAIASASDMVLSCIKWLDANEAITTVGLFRVAGQTDDVEALSKDFDLPCKTVPNVASLAKLTLRELPVSLIPESVYNDVVAIGTVPSAAFTSKMIEILPSFPQAHATLLRNLTCWLSKVAASSTVNKMAAENLAIVFSPTILKPPADLDPMQAMKDVQAAIGAVKQLIENVSEVWGSDGVSLAFKELGIDSHLEEKRSNKMVYGSIKRQSNSGSKPGTSPPPPPTPLTTAPTRASKPPSVPPPAKPSSSARAPPPPPPKLSSHKSSSSV